MVRYFWLHLQKTNVTNVTFCVVYATDAGHKVTFGYIWLHLVTFNFSKCNHVSYYYYYIIIKKLQVTFKFNIILIQMNKKIITNI